MSHRIIGFEELGNVDGFETVVLDLRLSASGQHVHHCVLDSVHDICAGVIQKMEDNSLEVVYKVSSSRRDDNEVFDLDE